MVDRLGGVVEYEELPDFNFAEAYQVVGEFMLYYNEVRIHSSIGYQPPLEYHNKIMSNSVKALRTSA